LRFVEERSKANENEYSTSTDQIRMEQKKLEVALNVMKKVNAQLTNLIEDQMNDIKRELDRCKEQTKRAGDYLCSLLEDCKIQVDRVVEVARKEEINAVSAATQRIEIEKAKLDEALTDALTADEETRQLRSRYTTLEQQYLALRERAGQLEIVCDQADAAERELLDCNRKVNGQLDALKDRKVNGQLEVLKRGSIGMEKVSVEELEQLKQELADLQLRANHDRSEAARNGIALAQKTHEAVLREKELTAELNDLQRALAEKEEKLRRLKEELRKYSAPECPFAGASQASRPKPPAVWDALPKRNTRAKSTGDALSTVPVTNPSNETPLKGRGAAGDENMAPSPEVNNSSKVSSGKKNQSASLSCKQQ